MPIVSNLAWTQRSSSPLSWRKVDSFEGPCVGHAGFHSSAPVMLRTPFRSLNGKAYAVPLSMALEFDALLRRASRKTTTPVDGRALMAAPGVLWRHDPYSTKVLSPVSPRDSSRGGLSAASDDADDSRTSDSLSFPRADSVPFATGAPLLPSARPLPPPGAYRRLVIPPPAQPPREIATAREVPAAHETSGAREAPAARETTAAAAREAKTDLPRSLAVIRSLPPLFGDLAEHVTRRPVCLGNIGRAPTAPGEVHYVYIIGHRCRRTVCAAALPYAVDEIVVIEGDMGIEMGLVQTALSVKEFGAMSPSELVAYGFPTDRDTVRAAFVLRAATDAERARLKLLRELEADLLSFLQNGLDPVMFDHCHVEHMEFLDCEFQADFKKIYVYYQAKQHVLFRELAQYLYSLYRCRIWLHEVGRGSPAVSNDSSRGTDNSAERETD